MPRRVGFKRAPLLDGGLNALTLAGNPLSGGMGRERPQSQRVDRLSDIGREIEPLGGFHRVEIVHGDGER